MLVPEAPVDEDGGSKFREHQVRPPRKVATVEAKAEAGGVKHRPEAQLWLRILSPDAGHHS